MEKHIENNTTCAQCSRSFYLKPSRRKEKRTLGFFCSVTCSAIFKSNAYLGTKNPNNKNRNFDCDGYQIFSPQTSLLLSKKKIKLHIAVACEILQLESIPKGHHVHHRDCDVLNNSPDNLAVLKLADHVWLHKQFGNATLWAFMHGKISLNDLVSWSDDKVKAETLLTINILKQAKGG